MQLKNQLAEILEGHRGERHLVVLHEYPDPDSISTAFAHRLISAAYDISTDIVHSGKVSHQQNLALVRMLDIDLLRWEETPDLARYQAAVFVDNQGSTVEGIVAALEAARVPVLLVVDHHPMQDRVEAECLEIQQTGSTATIYAAYLQQGVVELDSARKDHTLAATALMHGILSDTGGFIRAGGDDFQAAAYLSRFRDAELLEQIMSQARSKHAMDIIHRALGERTTVESYSISGIGYIRAEDRDSIPEAAGFLLTEENVHTSIVYAIVEDTQGESLIGSLRTSKFTLDPDTFLKEVFGKDSCGRYHGGGRPAAGAFAIPLGYLSGNRAEEFRELNWRVHDAQTKHKILTKIGAKSEALRAKGKPVEPTD